MRKMIFIALGASLSLAGCGQSTRSPQAPIAASPFTSDRDDCDLDDMLERDEDCGFSKRHKKSTHASKSSGFFSSKPTYSKPRSTSSRSSSRSSRRK